MIQYHVWFRLKPATDEAEGLAAIRSFLSEMVKEGRIAAFHVLRNTAAPPKTKLLPYHALIEFHHLAQVDSTFARQHQIGIHAEPHGSIMNLVAEFHAELFSECTTHISNAEREK